MLSTSMTRSPSTEGPWGRPMEGGGGRADDEEKSVTFLGLFNSARLISCSKTAVKSSAVATPLDGSMWTLKWTVTPSLPCLE